MALLHAGNPGLCMPYVPSHIYLDRTTKKGPSPTEAQDTFDRPVQHRAYNDPISPAVKELYKNHARMPHEAGLLDSCFGSAANFGSLSGALGIGRKFRVLERSFLEMDLRQ